MGTVEGCVCVCVCIVQWGRELYVIVMDLLDVTVHVYGCDCHQVVNVCVKVVNVAAVVGPETRN